MFWGRHWVLRDYQKQASLGGDLMRKELISRALGLLDVPANEEERPNLDAVAEAWLDLIRETWYEKLTSRGRFKPLRLKDIRRDLKNKPIPTEKIEMAFGGIPPEQPIHTRVVSAIVGIPD